MARAGRGAFALALVLAVGCGDDGSGTDDGSESDASTSPNTTNPATTNPTTTTTATATDATVTGDGTATGTSTEETGTPVTVDYIDDIQPIWDLKCVAGCHIETGSAQVNGPILTAEKSYAALVDVPSPTVAGLDEVEPGDTAKSYLWHKIDGTFANVGGLGTQMPQVGTLSEEELGKIEAWIEAGALP